MSDENSNEIEKYLCTSCGAEVKEEDRVCPFCGADLSEIVEMDPVEPSAEADSNESVVLKTLLSAEDALVLIKNLEANQIRAAIGLKPWSDTSGITTVVVRREDFERAKTVVELMANTPKPMQLGDIFSNSFTIAAKTLKKNLLLSLMLIPAGILIAFIIKGLIGSISSNGATGEKIKVTVEKVSKKIISTKFNLEGTIDSAGYAVAELDSEDVSYITIGDSAWINLVEDGYNYNSAIINNILMDSSAVPDSNGITEITYKVIAAFNDTSTLVNPGNWCEIELVGRTNRAVPCLSYETINPAFDKSLFGNPGVDYTDEEEDYNKREVYVVSEGKVKRKIINLGLHGEDYTEVASGLNEGDVIVKEYFSTDKELKDGAAVVIDSKAADFNVWEFIWFFILLFMAIMIFGILYLAFNIGVTKSALKTMQNEEIYLKALFRFIFSSVLWRSIGLFLLIGLIIGGAFIVLAILISIGAGIKNTALIAIGGILFIPAFAFGLVYVIRLYFSFIYLIDTNGGIIESIKKSSALVKGYWWRTFGIFMLISLIINFLVSLITTPASLVLMWDYISKSFQGEAASPKQTADLMKAFGWGYVLLTLLTYIIEALIMPVFNVSMYYDLRSRKNDFLVKVIEDNKNQEELTVGE